MSFRPGFRTASSQAYTMLRSQWRHTFSRRWQSTASSGDAAAAAAKPKENVNPLSWNSPVGPKTVHFWAPVMKWALVGATVTDFARPVEGLSMTQSAALTATGLIWTRWCLIIKPKNYLLAAVNFFLFLANSVQLGRVVNYQYFTKKVPVEDDARALVQELKDTAKDAKDIVVEAVSK